MHYNPEDSEATVTIGYVAQYTQHQSLQDLIATYLGSEAGDFDVDELNVEYNNLIATRLPAGVVLIGDQIMTTAAQAEHVDQSQIHEAFQVPEDEFTTLIQRHDKTLQDDRPSS